MGKVNTATKQYMKKNEIMADAFNFLIYDGEQIIQPEFLSELDSVEVDITYGDELSELSVEKIRDIFKFLVLKTDGNTVYALLGIENQEAIHYTMPVRTLIYDALAYVDQVKRIARKLI